MHSKVNNVIKNTWDKKILKDEHFLSGKIKTQVKSQHFQTLGFNGSVWAANQ